MARLSCDKQSDQRGRVLVLGTDQRVILAVVRSLGRQGLTVDLGWCPANSMAARSRYVSHVHDIPAYSRHDDRWKRKLLTTLAQERYDLVIPCNDSTLVPLIANRAEFAPFPEVFLLPDPVFSVVSDKFQTYQLAVDARVDVPRGRVVDGSADPDELIREFGLPLILKPRATMTTESTAIANVVRRLPGREAVAAALRELGSRHVLVQENFAGRGTGIEMLVKDGQVLFAFQHARIHETMEWGSSYRRSVEVMPALLAAAQRLMQALQYTGVAMAEFILDPRSGRSVFLEINGRFWGSLPLAVAAGADFPFYLYQMLVEQQTTFPDRYRRGVYGRNLLLDIGWLKSRTCQDRWRHLTMPGRLVGQLAAAVMHRDHLDSFSVDDPRPQWAELRELAGRVWSKLTRRIAISPPATPFRFPRSQQRRRSV